MSSSSSLILSAKAIKKLTKDELGYDLSSNAFKLLNQRVTGLLQEGHDSETINNWLSNVLKKAADRLDDNSRRKVKKSDLESIIDNSVIRASEINEQSVKDESFESTQIAAKDFDHVVDCIGWRPVEIVQLRSQDVRDLEEEVERLKKIIQIILNKQAELV